MSNGGRMDRLREAAIAFEPWSLVRGYFWPRCSLGAFT